MTDLVVRPALRKNTQLIVGIYGEAKAGKTFSSLRLGTGMRSVVGGGLVLVNTEGSRGHHYADDFDYRVIDLEPPYSPQRYMQALDLACKDGAGTIVFDQMSYEHEGEGGVLDMHEAELQRLAGDDMARRNRCKFTAWIRPKRERRRLIEAMLRCERNLILNFRAKEKLKMVSGKDPEQLGWMPIGASDYAYQCIALLLLTPGSRGVPTWRPAGAGAQLHTVVPRQFAPMDGVQAPLDEECGAWMASWAQGGEVAQPQEENV